MNSRSETFAKIVPGAARRRVSVLGSTGSVGSNTVELIASQPDRFVVEALTANSNIKLLAQQAIRLKAKIAVTADPDQYGELKQLLLGTGIDVAAGKNALIEVASRDVDWIMAAIIGSAGLPPTLAAIRTGTVVALANKESLVCAGQVMMDNVQQYGATLLPVDSEHNAIFQVLEAEQASAVKKLILTASGGPFREMALGDMRFVTPKQAVAHPNWDMGKKISIDSATMMNKGLELIEAEHLFSVGLDQIDVLVHPQSVIHSMVAYTDGSVLAQMGAPDMKTPISYTLGWPDRFGFDAQILDLAAIGSLTFFNPDPIRFPSINLARQAMKQGGTAPTVLNAANEVAVEAFLKEKIGFLDIVDMVKRCLNECSLENADTIEDIFEADRNARRIAASFIG